MNTKDAVNTDLTTLYNEVADFFASSPSAHDIFAYRLSEASEQVVSDLLEANRTRGLTPDERISLDDYTRIERLVQAIKIRALTKLKQQP